VIGSETWTTDDRRSVVDELARLRREFEEAQDAADAAPEDPAAEQAEGDLADQVIAMAALYRSALPVVPISRCPFTGLELHHPIDTFGFDGPYWDVDNPIRPWPGNGPATLCGITGSVRLAEEIEHTPHLAVIGPGAPAVVRDLMDEETRAVISQIEIGAHTATVVCYFRPDSRDRIPNAPEWGTRTWWERDAQEPTWRTDHLIDDDYDFDLEPYLEQERLVWIAPGDATLTLRTGSDGCPYLGTEGGRHVQRLEEGSVW